MKIIVCLLMAAWPALGAVAQEKLQLVLTPQPGYGPFKDRRFTPIRSDAAPEPTAIPADVKEYRVRQIDFQPYNTWYRTAVEKGHRNVLGSLESFYQPLLTAAPYTHELAILVGIDTAGKKIVIADVNGNLSFIDDDAYTFEQFAALKPELEAKNRLPFSRTQSTIYNGHTMVSRELNLLLDPYQGLQSKRQADTGDARFFLDVGLIEHQRGTLAVNGRTYRFFLSNHFSGLLHRPKQVELLMSADTTVPQDAIPYETGDLINIGGNNYTFESVTLLGDTVTLRYAGKAGEDEGFQRGNIPPAVAALTLDGAPFSLSDYRGKYVLMDFWGTWCVPCMANLPELRAVAEKFRNRNVVVVSVANDRSRQVVKQVVQHERMNWVHVFQDKAAGGKEAELINRLKIKSYPTFLLLDPAGRIVARDEPLRIIAGRLEAARP